jgi:hypothetical protein
VSLNGQCKRVSVVKWNHYHSSQLLYESKNRKASTVRSAHQDQKKRWVN